VPNQQCEDNIRRAFEYLGQPSDAIDVSEFFDTNWVNHDPTLPPFSGLEGARQLRDFFRKPFSELRIEIEKLVSQGDYVAGHFTVSGKHTGDFMGLAPTNRSFSITGTGLFRCHNGKMAENWVNIDALGLMQQLGIVPMPGQTGQKAA
jgi:predicted ester cyclase